MAAEDTNCSSRGRSQSKSTDLANLMKSNSSLKSATLTSSIMLGPEGPNEDEGEKTPRSSIRPSVRDSWPRWRQIGETAYNSKSFDVVLGLIIVFNMVLIVVETDAEADCAENDLATCRTLLVKSLNWGLLAFYTVESFGRMIVFQSYFHKNWWNIADVIVLVICYVEICFWAVDSDAKALQIIRIFRLGRLLRVVRLVKVFPSLYSMVRGFVGTIFAIGWGFGLILTMLVLWSILAVQFIHMDNKTLYAEGADDWCAIAFSSVWNSVVYFFQTLVIGDSWGLCVIPLVREFPVHFWLFSLAFITVQLGITNLILAVIVDTAAQVREEDIQERVREKKHRESEARLKLMSVVQKVDEDGSGSITLSELLNSYDNNNDFQSLMAILNLERKDMERMLTLMDTDRSGSLSYSEIVDSIAMAGEQDPSVQLMMIKLELAEISWHLRNKTGLENMGSPRTTGHASVQKAARTEHSQATQSTKIGDVGDNLRNVAKPSVPGRSKNSSPVPMVSFDSGPQAPPAISLDRLQVLVEETVQEVANLASSARRLGSVSIADGSTVPPHSARSADSFSSPRDAAGNDPMALPRTGVEQKRQQQERQNRLSDHTSEVDAIAKYPVELEDEIACSPCKPQVAKDTLAHKWISRRLENLR